MLVICLDNGIISESSTLAVRPADRRLSVYPATVARLALARCGLAATFYSGSVRIRSLQTVMSRLPEEQCGSVEAGAASMTMRAFVQYFGLCAIIVHFGTLTSFFTEQNILRQILIGIQTKLDE